MTTRTRTPLLAAIIAVLLAGCTIPSYIRPPDPFTGPSDTGYYWPNFTAELTQPDGQYIVVFSAEQRSPDVVGAYGTVTVDGTVIYNANLQATAGTAHLNLTPGWHTVEVHASWREAVELLWQGLVYED